MARVAIALAGIASALTLAGCGNSNPLGLPCNPAPQGALCLKIYNDHLEVRDVIAYLSASDSPLAGKTWRLVITADHRAYPGVVQHGLPPLQVFCKDANGETITTGAGCHDTLGAAYASHGSFPGFNPPVSLKSAGDICVNEQIETSGTWRTVKRPAPVCTAVS